MANHDRQLRLLSEELVTVMEAALEDLDDGRDPIVLLRHAGDERYLPRRYRTREVQQIESSISGLERIQAKLGIPRQETILGVFDRFVEIHREPPQLERGHRRETPCSIQDVLRAALQQLKERQP